MIDFRAIAHILTPAGYNRNIRQNQDIDSRKTNLLKISIKKGQTCGSQPSKRSNSLLQRCTINFCPTMLASEILLFGI